MNSYEITDEELLELAKIKCRKYDLKKETEDLSNEFQTNDLKELLEKYNDLKCTSILIGDDFLLESIEEKKFEISNLWNKLIIGIRRNYDDVRDGVLASRVGGPGETIDTCLPDIAVKKITKPVMDKIKDILNNVWSKSIDLKKCILEYEIWCEMLDNETSSKDLSPDQWIKLGKSCPKKLRSLKAANNIDSIKLIIGYNLLDKIKQLYEPAEKKFSKLKDKQTSLIAQINNMTEKLKIVEVNSISKISRTLAKTILKYSKSRSEEKVSFLSRIMGRKSTNPNEKYGSRLALNLFISDEIINKDSTIMVLVKLAKLGLANSYKLATKLPGKKLKEAALKAYGKVVQEKSKSDGHILAEVPTNSTNLIKKLKKASLSDIGKWYW